MEDLEEWRDIIEFPGYAVSSRGRVWNTDYDRLKIASTNQAGVLNVLLIKDGLQYRRSVPVMVAKAFLPTPRYKHFTTLIHLDGDRTICNVETLAWRPRWFSIKYHQQFKPGAARGFKCPVEEVQSQEVFDTSWQAATKYGLLDTDILVATMNQTYVFPTGQRFRVLD